MKTSIFYFDDEVILLELFREMFGDEYEVRTASALSEAQSMLSTCPDIIISDWSMPEISGTEFLQQAAEACPESFRILLTGFGQLGDMIEEVSSGLIQFFLAKPWNELQMRRVLERATVLHTRSNPQGA